MNLKLNGNFKSLSLYFATLLFVLNSLQAGDDFKCIPDIVKSYGMEGVPKPQEAKLGMCPMIKQTCCTVPDQIVFYKNWIIGGESGGLKEKMVWYEGIYSGFLDELVRIYQLAQKMEVRLADRQVSNCKVLTSRIMHFQIEGLSVKLKDIIKNFHGFMHTSYNGFYCSVCDAAAHKWYSVGTKEIVFARKFCRDVMANSFHFLLYFNLHLTKYTNLVVKFLNYCDANGTFDEKTIEGQVLFSESPQRLMLEGCKAERNSDNWFQKCEDICKNFNIGEYNEFWTPNLDKFREVTPKLADMRKKMEDQFKKTSPVEFVKMTKKSRVLTDKGLGATGDSGSATNPATADGQPLTDEEKKKQAEQEKKIKDPIIFKSPMILVPLTKFKQVFTEFGGLDLFQYGQKTSWDDDYYNKLNEQIKKSGKPSEIASESSAVYGKGVEDFRAGASATRLVVMTLGVFAALFIRLPF